VLTVGVVALLAVVAVAFGSWRFSSVLLVPDHDQTFYDWKVTAVGPANVTLERDEDSERPGLYGLDWPGGHALVGDVLRRDDDTVTRTLLDVRGRLRPGTEVELDPNVWDGDPRSALGIPFERVRVKGELGPMPAWQVDGRGDTWAIFVHGINGSPRGGLRVLRTLHRVGMPSLLITYRNDPGAPPAADGLHHLGMTEWHDVEAAARHALDNGARRLVVIGYSMGGAIVTQFAQRSVLRDRIEGLILDAPALSWKPILELGASERGFPKALATPVTWAVGTRIDIDWDRLDALRHADALRLPILLFHGGQDSVVPTALSERLARELPRDVELHLVPRAGHVESWNVDPRRYERRVRAFLDRIDTAAGARASVLAR
jgi:pimeloyl-ACP methyl ester carboxylesterase